MLKVIATIDRYSRWILLVIMLLFIISGFGMTRGFMDRTIAREIHTDYLPIPLFILVGIHVFLPLRTQIMRWKIFKDQKTIDIYTAIICLIFLGLCFWLFF